MALPVVNCRSKQIWIPCCRDRLCAKRAGAAFSAAYPSCRGIAEFALRFAVSAALCFHVGMKRTLNIALTVVAVGIMLASFALAQNVGKENKMAGKAFLAENKTKPGVVTLHSGLQYKIEKQGTGRKPRATDSVECNYRGTMIDGKEFDSSYKRGQTATFPVNRVIPGWTEILQLMPVGSKYKVFIPSDLAYGERGAGADIGPNATLIFDIELIAIK